MRVAETSSKLGTGRPPSRVIEMPHFAAVSRDETRRVEPYFSPAARSFAKNSESRRAPSAPSTPLVMLNR